MSFTEIKKQSKDSFNIQATKSKSKNIDYKCLELQSYLKPGNKMTIEEECFAFQAKSHYVPVLNATLKVI